MLKAKNQPTEHDVLVCLIALRSAALSGNPLTRVLCETVRDHGQTLLPKTYENIDLHEDVFDGLACDAQQLNLPLLTDLKSVVSICQHTGAPILQSLDQLIKRLQLHITQQHQIEEELASVKATVIVLMFLPAFGPLLGSIVGINVIQTLVTTPWGIVCLILGIGLEFLGWLWMRSLIKKVQQSV